MANPAFIIDGYTEKGIIQTICPKQPIRRLDLNGKDVSIPAISKKVASLIRLLGDHYYPIIILLDKEEREITIEDMINQLHCELIREGITGRDIRIGVADRMIENWIIADWQNINPSTSKPHDTDGLNGSAVIRKEKGSYSKTSDGTELFISSNQSVIYKNSPSYRNFIDKLVGIKCRYLDFDRA